MFRKPLDLEANKVLATFPIFRGLTPRELAAVGRCTTQVAVERGAVLCREGSYGQEAFVILQGAAVVTVDSEEIARLGPGAVCGEMALLERGVRSATVTALSPLEVLAMSIRDFETMLDTVPVVARRLLSTMSWRLRTVEHAYV